MGAARYLGDVNTTAVLISLSIFLPACTVVASLVTVHYPDLPPWLTRPITEGGLASMSS